jgi:probable H4MPT-linked C1 transfer pathway protein
MAAELGPAEAAAVTMTAELSDAFRTKREGVGFVLDAVPRVAGGAVRVFTTRAGFVDVAAARARPLEVAASNWMATATLAARAVGDGLLVDTGSTTTDVIPIRAGRVAARGYTDPERLLAGELVYTGAVRTNVAAIVSRVPLGGAACPVAAEYFAVSGDAHVLRGDLAPEDYTCPTPDGRPPTAEFAAERLARVVCADAEMLGWAAIEAIAAAVAEAQVAAIASALARVAGSVGPSPLVAVTGQGAFLAHRAAARCGLPSRDLSALLGVEVGTAAPAVAVAWLLLDGGA